MNDETWILLPGFPARLKGTSNYRCSWPSCLARRSVSKTDGELFENDHRHFNIALVGERDIKLIADLLLSGPSRESVRIVLEYVAGNRDQFSVCLFLSRKLPFRTGHFVSLTNSERTSLKDHRWAECFLGKHNAFTFEVKALDTKCPKCHSVTQAEFRSRLGWIFFKLLQPDTIDKAACRAIKARQRADSALIETGKMTNRGNKPDPLPIDFFDALAPLRPDLTPELYKAYSKATQSRIRKEYVAEAEKRRKISH